MSASHVTVTPFLWFDANAEEAIERYLSVFDDAELIGEQRHPDGSLFIGEISLQGQRLTLMNGGPHVALNEAFSLSVSVETQDEVDTISDALIAGGGHQGRCGWLVDAFGLSEELRDLGIAANSLWPRTAIDTAAVRNVVGAGLSNHSRTPAIMADAAHEIVTRPSRECTGNFFIDDDVLEEAGVTDFSIYLNGGEESDLALDFWVEPKGPHDPRLSL